MLPEQDASIFSGYGSAELAEVDDINKALEAQEGVTDIANLQGGGALQPQSLEGQLAMLTFQEKHLRLFKDIGIVKAFSTLEEYSVQDGYGAEGGFVGQLENPEEGDPDFRREFAVVKYIRQLWKTADVLQYTRTITDPEVKNVQAAMMRALRILERTLFFGDSSIIPSSFDGLKKTIEDNGTVQHIFDLRGGALTEAKMRDAAELISTNYGSPTDMYLSNSAQTAVDKQLFDNGSQRYDQKTITEGFVALGSSVTSVKTSFGNFNLKPDIFINPESEGVPVIKNPANPKATIEGATSTKAPPTPSFTVTAAAGAAGSLWAASGSGGAIAGEYDYRVAAVNAYGKSAAAAIKSATVVAGGKITVDITPGAGAYAPTGYIIYRETAPDSGKIRKLVEVAAATPTYVDLNENLSGTSQSFLIDNTTQGELRTLALAQLAPMHKVNYAKIAPYKWGTVNMYAVPKYYAPLRFVMFKNIGIGTEVRNPVIDL
jgi:hypothetical protein